MKFSLASIPLAILASTAAAQPPVQGPPQNGVQQWQWGPPQQQPQQQPYACWCPNCPTCIGVTPGQYPGVTDPEVTAWVGCLKDWLSDLSSNSKGDAPACKFYNCLQKVATTYRAGGPIVAIGKPLGIACATLSPITDAAGNVFHAITGGLVR
jgi:hypothetical protein